MIKSDDPFIHNNAVWKIGVTYHRQKDATLNINLNMVVNPFQDKKAKVYFKKNEFFLKSNYQMNGEQHAIELFADTSEKTEEELEELEFLKDKIDSIMKLYPQHSFISLLSATRTNSQGY
jgi:hypothetical protein